MPADDSPAVLVARFLRANHYTETLDAYLQEAGLPPDAGTISKDSFTIEKLLEEKKAFDISSNFEKLGLENGASSGWRQTAPCTPARVTTLPSASNILDVSLLQVLQASGDLRPHLVATTADRRLSRFGIPSLALEQSSTALQDSPILSSVNLTASRLLCTSMSGQLVLADHDLKVVQRRRDHSKYVVKVAVHHPTSASDTTWIATAGWDAKVNVYKLDSGASINDASLPEPSVTVALPSNPEAILFVKHPDHPDDESILIITRRDSSFLHYYNPTTGALLGKQNLAPQSNAWVAFSPSSIAISPTDPTLLAVATSSMPHMKLIVVRLLLPSPTSEPLSDQSMPPPTLAPTPASLLDGPSPATQQARTLLAQQDREVAAVQVHVSTFATQTAYSTPALVWRPDGSGVWVNGDDGIVRGFEAITGKLKASLGGLGKDGHEPGSKIRCLAAGMVPRDESGEEEEEWLVSGGFDQKLIVWRPEEVA